MVKTNKPFRAITPNSTYWDKRVALNESFAQKAMDKVMGWKEQDLKRAYKEMKTSIMDLYLDVQSRGLDTITRTELYQFQKWSNLTSQIELQFGDLTNSQNEQFEKALKEIYEETFNRSLKDVLPNTSLDFTFLSDDHLDKKLKSMWSGQDFKTLGKEGNEAVAQRLISSMEKMIVEGRNPEQLKKELMDDLNISYNKANRLIRTEGSFMFNEANKTAYKVANVAQVEILVEDDACDECLEYLETNDGIYDIDSVPHIPAHPNCRCSIAPYIEVPE